MNAVYCVPGMVHWGKVISKALDWPLFAGCPVGDDVETVWIVGWYDPPHYGQTLEHTKRAKRRICSWHGSDARMLTDAGVLPESINVADSEQISQHLRGFGIESIVIPVPTTVHAPVTPLPDKPVIGCYLGDSSRKYNQGMALAVAEAMPDVDFHFYQTGMFSPTEMLEVMAKTSAFLRLTSFEGSCVSAREYLEAGRPVVGSLYCATHKVDTESLESCVRGTRKALKDGLLPELRTMYWKDENSVEKWRERIGGIL